MVDSELSIAGAEFTLRAQGLSPPRFLNSQFTLQTVRVTMLSSRGLSGSNPFTSASKAAKICPGTM